MSDKQFTCVELHFHDGIQLGPRTLGDGDVPALDGDADESASEPEIDPEPASEESDSGGPSVLGPLFGLGLLVAAAYAVRKLLAGDSEGLDALDDIEEAAEEHADDLQTAAEDRQTEAEESVPIEITSPDEEADGSLALVVAAAVGLLVIIALAARKLLGGSEEIVVEE